jgi:hypothetical protein
MTAIHHSLFASKICIYRLIPEGGAEGGVQHHYNTALITGIKLHAVLNFVVSRWIVILPRLRFKQKSI